MNAYEAKTKLRSLVIQMSYVSLQVAFNNYLGNNSFIREGGILLNAAFNFLSDYDISFAEKDSQIGDDFVISMISQMESYLEKIQYFSNQISEERTDIETWMADSKLFSSTIVFPEDREVVTKVKKVYPDIIDIENDLDDYEGPF